MSGGITRDTTYTSLRQRTVKGGSLLDKRFTILNERLGALQRNCLPASPYLLAIQSRRQFHLSEHQHKEEVKESDCGFKPEEREQQYLSFLKTGWNKTILTVLQPSQRTNGVIKPQAMASASTIPKTAAKKISIADYKKRSSLPTSTLNGSTGVDESKSRAISSTLVVTHTPSGLKRLVSDSFIPEQKLNVSYRNSDALEKPKTLPSSTLEPPVKKLKTSPQLGSSEEKVSIVEANFSLPPPLSPTLPVFVEKVLAKPEETVSKESKVPSKNGKQSEEQTKAILNGTSSGKKSSLDRSASQPFKPVANGVHRPANDAPISSSRSKVVDTGLVRPTSKEPTSSVPSVVVTLKIPRERRKDVSRLIKLPPKRVKEATPVPKQPINGTRSGQDKIPAANSKSAGKRPREDDGLDINIDRKRSKSPSHQDRTNVKKVRESTPVMKEEVTTPQASVMTNTPIPPSSASRFGHKHTPSESGSISSATSDRLEGLQKLQTKYSDLGRTLKKEGDKLLSPDMTAAQKRKFIASRMEVTLVFMLSYTIGDEVFRLRRRPPKPEATWNSLFAWMRSVHELVHDHPHLSGLLLQLEAISTMVVWRQRSEAAEFSDTPPSLDKFKELRVQCEDAQRKFLKGSARLSVDDLQDEFPKTWKSKARQPLAHLGYKMAKDNLNGDFYLPLTSISLPIEGVRAGKTLLAEWCRREGVEWVASLDF